MILKTLFLLLVGSATSGWATTILGVGPTPVTVSVGDTFTAGVYFVNQTLFPGDTAPPVAGFSFDIAFPTFLEVDVAPVESGYFLSNGFFYTSGTIDNGAGTISGIADGDPFNGGDPAPVDVLVEIQFKAIGTGTGQITIQNASLSQVDPNDSSNFIDLPVANATASDVSAVTPEPATWSIAGLGFAMVMAGRRRRSPR